MEKIAPVILILVVIVSMPVWFTTRDTLPDEIIIATGRTDGMYHRLSVHLKSYVEERAGKSVKILKTNGSAENKPLLDEGKACRSTGDTTHVMGHR